MNNEPTNLENLPIPIVSDPNIGHGDVWIGPANSGGPPKRLLEAFARGETTKGGLAEAGWYVIGRIADDGIDHD